MQSFVKKTMQPFIDIAFSNLRCFAKHLLTTGTPTGGDLKNLAKPKILIQTKLQWLHELYWNKYWYEGEHSVLRGVLTFNISNMKKVQVFDTRIHVRIMWYIWFFPA